MSDKERIAVLELRIKALEQENAALVAALKREQERDKPLVVTYQMKKISQ